MYICVQIIVIQTSKTTTQLGRPQAISYVTKKNEARKNLEERKYTQHEASLSSILLGQLYLPYASKPRSNK